MAKPDVLHVEVVYALPERQLVAVLELPPDARVQDAIEASGLPQSFPLLDWTMQPVGIYGRTVTHDTRLQQGDRVEIYRPLTRDPKQARRELAKIGKTMGKTGAD